MRQVARFRVLNIPNKLRIDVGIIVDDRSPVRTSTFEGNLTTNISLNPFITISISRPWEVDGDGKRVRPLWNPNDSLSLTRYSLPIFLRELKEINKSLEIKELYSYQGTRLELNEAKAEEVRRVFMVGNTTLELTPIVIIQPNDEQRVEGVKMKFNNESSTVELTINDLCSMIFNLEHMNADEISMKLYESVIKKDGFTDPTTNMPKVDIAPKADQFNATDFI